MPAKPKHQRNSRMLAFAVRLKIAYSAFHKTAEIEEILKIRESEKEKEESKRIRCPLCSWSPTASSRWVCDFCPFPEQFYGGCGTSWNTFETQGRCPGCRHQWRWTSCLRCSGWSLHDEWYEKN